MNSKLDNTSKSLKQDQYKRLISMNAVPRDLSNYFVKVKSVESKEMLLPVQSVAESKKDGRAVYKVAVSLPELVQESETGYKPGYDFYISKSHSNQQGVYTSFASLLEAMKSNMAGNYVLGADLDASEVSLAASDYVYLRNNFTGSYNGKQYAIYNLAKPLFENLKSGARISNIDLKDVNIVGTYDSASLARSAENAHIQDVSAQGRVAVVGNASQVAGLVVVATNTQIINSSFTGTIQTNDKQSKAYNVGGLVANLKGNASLLTQSRADVTILASAKTNEQRFGGLVGRLEDNARITNSYVSGKIQNSTKNGQIGGVVGSNYYNGLIDNDVITRRENKDSGKYARNGYLSLSLFSPIYSALSNPTGAPGDVMFRRTAYELLAAKGYHEGFIPYVSGKLSEEALKEGSTTWDGWLGRDVGLVTDQKVLENVFKGEYDTWAAFKKAMYQERIDKLTKLKPITIEYELRTPNSTKQVTIRSYKDMQRLMDEATAEDVRNIDNATSRVEASWVNLLKKKIYNAYLRTTDDFRQSIFTK